MHGHNYVAYFTARAAHLDSIGRVIDFSVLKARIGGWIDANWDHGFIYFYEDKEVAAALATFKQKVFPLDANPTAENMADYLLRVVCPEVLSGSGVEVIEVKLEETENCYAIARL